MSNVNPETGEVVDQGRSQRFTLWVAFLVFSTITMGASVQVKNDATNPTSEAKWAVACSAVTFAVTACVVFAHLSAVAASVLVGSKIEGTLILILTAFWAATVSIVTNASNNLATDNSSTNQVSNGNLYYFSWAGFVTAIILFVSYLRSAFGIDVAGEIRNRAARLTLWAALLASGLVVLGSAARIQNEDCASDGVIVGVSDPSIYCKRTKFAIALGSLSVAFSAVTVGMKMVTSAFMVEFFLSIILATLNAFGVAYITSPKGPGSPIGNLYYFTWISFLCSAMLAAECFNQYSGGAVTDVMNRVKGQNGQNGSPTSRSSNGGADIEVETFDDQI